MDRFQITIIGAGVVGLAVAAELSRKWEDILVVERHETFGRETSSRNSEVIHSGIYYPEGSLKAALCVEGAALLQALCEEQGIAHKRLGKLIVATCREEVPLLETLRNRGLRNGAGDLVLLEQDEVRRMEPRVNAVAALYSPHTGIVDSHGLMRYFHLEAQSRGVLFAFHSEVVGLETCAEGFFVNLREEGYRFLSRMVINCAGLGSDRMAELAGVDLQSSGYRLSFCKGSYFAYAGESPVSRLIYPVPHQELVGLGVHATLDLGGRLRFGPDTEYVDTPDYVVDTGKRDAFFDGAVRIISGLDRDAFVPDMAGIRPKLQGKGEGFRDFVIAEESDRGLQGLVNLIGIESPGLTSSPAIARQVAGMVANFLI